jgi:hypothetical protein
MPSLSSTHPNPVRLSNDLTIAILGRTYLLLEHRRDLSLSSRTDVGLADVQIVDLYPSDDIHPWPHCQQRSTNTRNSIKSPKFAHDDSRHAQPIMPRHSWELNDAVPQSTTKLSISPFLLHEADQSAGKPCQTYTGDFGGATASNSRVSLDIGFCL